MPASRKRTAGDRVFVRNGRRTYRRTYSPTEFRIGLGVLVALAALLTWVLWRGANPDPALFDSSALIKQGEEVAGDRGPLPGGLALSGWSEGAPSQFGWDNLYVKINGREDYYKSFGFEMLYFISIVRDGDPEVTVDIEMYDLGSNENALGAYAGERTPGVEVQTGASGMDHIDRNALYMTRGKLYVRVIGAEESPAVVEQLEHLRALFDAELEGAPLPWGYALFAGAMGLDPGDVEYSTENAFSFGFANAVWSAYLEDGDTEVFAMAADDGRAAEGLAEQFHDGFLGYGTEAGDLGGIEWVKDRYAGGIGGAGASGPWVIGVRGAPDMETAAAAIGRLRAALAASGVEAAPVETAGEEENVPQESAGESEEYYGDQ